MSAAGRSMRVGRRQRKISARYVTRWLYGQHKEERGHGSETSSSSGGTNRGELLRILTGKQVRSGSCNEATFGESWRKTYLVQTLLQTTKVLEVMFINRRNGSLHGSGLPRRAGAIYLQQRQWHAYHSYGCRWKKQLLQMIYTGAHLWANGNHLKLDVLKDFYRLDHGMRSFLNRILIWLMETIINVDYIPLLLQRDETPICLKRTVGMPYSPTSALNELAIEHILNTSQSRFLRTAEDYYGAA